MSALEQRATDDTEDQVVQAEPAPRGLRLSPLGEYVHGQILTLTRRLDSPGARARLAQLRGAVGREPGSVPAVWDITVGGLPGPRPDGDAVTSTEWAAHTALTLYAVHQQAKSGSVHSRGWGLGASVAKLSDELNRPDAVRRRFDAVATASTPEECAHHLRGLITQFRGEDIVLDYGSLADDLARFYRGDDDGVRRRWARQFYRLDRTASVASPKAAAPVASSTDTNGDHR